MMKSHLYSGLLFAVFNMVTAAPYSSGCQSIESLSKRQNVDWDFTLYQNQQCTGQADRKSGAGSIGCTAGILNGSAAGYIKTFLDDGCTVRFYNQPGCPANAAAGVITAGTPSGECQIPLNGQIASYAVTCN